ncbi:MAG: Chagasin family peptidase inhibitor [Firmicutes bacterium]|nr:Chagasin family peptidase inhibitor [Bacillota bacterium]
MKKIIIILSLIMCITLPGAASVKEVKNYQYPISMTVIAPEDSSGGASQIIEVNTGDYFKVGLEAAGGTGYRWQLDDNNMDIVEFVDQTAAPVDPVFRMPGSKIRWEFYFKVKPNVSGQQPLRFYLRRGLDEIPVKEFLLTVIVQ